jgi:hypothetical protein
MIDSWMLLAQNAALGARTFVCEAGQILPKEKGHHAEVGGEVLEGMYTHGCSSIEDARISGGSGMSGGLDIASWSQPGPAGVVSKV